MRGSRAVARATTENKDVPVRRSRIRMLTGATALALVAALAPATIAQSAPAAEGAPSAGAAAGDDRPDAASDARRDAKANPMGSVKVAGVGVMIKVVQSNSTGKMTVRVN